MFVYEALHNSCIYESAAATISLHRTLKGAYNVVRKARWDTCVRNRDLALEYGNHGLRRGMIFEDSEWWGVRKIKVQDV